VSASGTISLRSADGSAEREQRQRLAGEGVVLDARGRVSLARFQWKRGVAP